MASTAQAHSYDNVTSQQSESAPLIANAHSLTTTNAVQGIGQGAEATVNGYVTTNGEAFVGQAEGESPSSTLPGTYATISVLLIGVFVSQTDTSLVLATYPRIASEFDQLSYGPWLITSFILAECVAQPLYGKLSEIYGRKACLQAAYVLFALGTLGSGAGTSMGEVIASRAVQGLGGAGMLSMVSIIITDLVPITEVGPLRSYVNILQTTGRGFGGVVGGLLTETIGWRGAFLIQVPPTILAIGLVQWRLRLKPSTSHMPGESARAKLKRIDVFGAVFLCSAIGTSCYLIDSAGKQNVSWGSSGMIATAAIAGLSIVAFIISGRYAAEPIFPLHLWVKNVVVTNYAIVFLIIMQQISLMASVPLYIQATSDVSQAVVGAYLIPAFFGNTIGGLVAGYWTKYTHTHKPVTLFGPLMGALAMILCLYIWTGQGSVSPLESLIIFPGGFGNGAVASSAFIALTAGVLQSEIAIAGTGMFLFTNMGAIAGVSAGSATYQWKLAAGLQATFGDEAGGATIIREALKDVNYVQRARPEVTARLVPVFVDAFHAVNYFGLGCAALAFLFAIVSPNSPMVQEVSEDEPQIVEGDQDV